MIKVIKPKVQSVSTTLSLTVVCQDVTRNVTKPLKPTGWRCHEGPNLLKISVKPNDIYLRSGWVDFRKGIDGLLIIIEYKLKSPRLITPVILCNKKKISLKLSTGVISETALKRRTLLQGITKKLFKWLKSNVLKHIRLCEQPH